MSPPDVRPESGGADPCAAPVATRWTAHDYSLEESALAGAAVRVARSLAADLMGTGISFVLAGADGRELGRFAESAHELDTLDAAVPATAGHWSGTTADEGDRPQQDGALPSPGRVHGRRRVYVAAPIRPEAEGRAAGLVVLAWTRGEANPLMEPLARLVARDVELALAEDAVRRAELLTHAFSSRRRSPRPLVVVGPDSVWANAAATQVPRPRRRGRDVGPRAGARVRPAPRGDGARPWRTVPRGRRGHPGLRGSGGRRAQPRCPATGVATGARLGEPDSDREGGQPTSWRRATRTERRDVNSSCHRTRWTPISDTSSASST